MSSLFFDWQDGFWMHLRIKHHAPTSGWETDRILCLHSKLSSPLSSCLLLLIVLSSSWLLQEPVLSFILSLYFVHHLQLSSCFKQNFNCLLLLLSLNFICLPYHDVNIQIIFLGNWLITIYGVYISLHLTSLFFFLSTFSPFFFLSKSKVFLCLVFLNMKDD